MDNIRHINFAPQNIPEHAQVKTDDLTPQEQRARAAIAYLEDAETNPVPFNGSGVRQQNMLGAIPLLGCKPDLENN